MSEQKQLNKMRRKFTDCSFVRRRRLHSHCHRHRSNLLEYSVPCSRTGTDHHGMLQSQ